jgi:hypothetical protein
MRKVTLTLVVIAFVVGAVPPTASAHEETEKVYLSLGTSLAAGSQADAAGNTTFSSDQSYTDQLYRTIRPFVRGLKHVKLGCPGETTDQFLGGVNAAGQPSNCAGLYDGGSQIAAAAKVVTEGNVVLITIDMGANDVIQAQTVCQGDPACIGAAIPGIAAGVGEIIATLRAAGYDGLIVAMNYFNPQIAAAIGFFPGVPGQHAPDPMLAGLSDQLIQGLNGALEAVYGAFGVPVANVYLAFNSGDFGDNRPANGVPDGVDVVCRLTSMCPDDPGVKANIHPNRHGYRVMAFTFLVELVRLEFGG